MAIVFMFGLLTSASAIGAKVVSGTLHYYAVALISNATTFDCITEASATHILWDHRSAITGHSTKLLDGASVKDERQIRIRIDHNRTDIDGSRLFINDIQPTDAGTYSCINGMSGATQLTAELTVLNVVPACHTDINTPEYIIEESNNVLITCNISSYGTFVPNVTCDIDSNQTRLGSAGFTSDNKSFRCYTWNVKATTAIHGSRVECRVWFEYQQETIYNSTWISPAISVAYGPRSITIHPQNQTEFEEGDLLTCTSEGYPQPDYHWTVGKFVVTGQALTVEVCNLNLTHGDSLSVPVLLKCITNRGIRTETATKDIRVNFNDTDRHRCITIHRKETPKDFWAGTSSETVSQFPLYLVIGAVAAVVFIIVVVGLLIGCCVNNRHRQAEQSTTTKRSGLYTPNNPFYDDAQTVGHDHYAELPAAYYSHGAYEEIDESAMVPEVTSPGMSPGPPLPYQHLTQEQRAPDQPAVYTRPGGTLTSGYIDIIDSTEADSKPASYQKLESESRDQHVPPGEYRQLGDDAHPLPYQHLTSERRELNRPPGVYRKLGGAPAAGYIDIIESTQADTKPTPYQKLESESRDKRAPPGEYRHLGDRTVDSAIPTGNTAGYIDVIDDVQQKSAAPSSYQKLKSDELPKQPAKPSEYNKLTANAVVVSQKRAVSLECP